MIVSTRRRQRSRNGLAALELTLCLPMLCFVLSIVTDYGRVFHDMATINDCARNGALQACGLLLPDPFSGDTQAAALANATDLSGTPTVTKTSGTDPSGNAYCEVTVTYTFHTLTPFPGVPSEVTISRTMRMAKAS